MLVYRLERKGIGPFISPTKAQGVFFWQRNTKKSKKAHHIQQQVKKRIQNGKISPDKTYMYGCHSKELLKAYFGFNLQPYFNEGFKIKAYEVPESEVVDYQHQLAFPVQYHKLKTPKRLKAQVIKVKKGLI